MFLNFGCVVLDVVPVRINGGVIILPGFTIGDNTIIGAGSVVTHDVTSCAKVADNPAWPLRS